MALKEVPKVGDKLRYWIFPDEYEVTHIDDSGTVTAKTKDGTSFNITEDDFELFDLVSKGADNMAEYTAENRVAKKGERIVIVAPNVHDSEDYERGDIFVVDKVDSAGVTTTTGNIVYHEEYEVLPGGVSRVIGYEDLETSPDNVNSPAHYTQGGTEVIDIIAQIAGGYSDGFEAYAVGNAIKYLARAPHKHATIDEDIAKAIRYLQFIQERRADGINQSANSDASINRKLSASS